MVPDRVADCPDQVVERGGVRVAVDVEDRLAQRLGRRLDREPAVGDGHEQVPGPGKRAGGELAVDIPPQVLELGRGLAGGLGLAVEPAAVDHQPVAGARSELDRVVLQPAPHQVRHFPAHRGFLQPEVHVGRGAVQVVQGPAPRAERLVLGNRQPRRRDEGAAGGPPLLPAFRPGPVGLRPGQQERDDRVPAVRRPARHPCGSSSSSGSTNTLRSRKLAPKRGGGFGVTGTAASLLRRRSASRLSRACAARCTQPGSRCSRVTVAPPVLSPALRRLRDPPACRTGRPAPGRPRGSARRAQLSPSGSATG